MPWRALHKTPHTPQRTGRIGHLKKCWSVRISATRSLQVDAMECNRIADAETLTHCWINCHTLLMRKNGLEQNIATSVVAKHRVRRSAILRKSRIRGEEWRSVKNAPPYLRIRHETHVILRGAHDKKAYQRECSLSIVALTNPSHCCTIVPAKQIPLF